MKITIELNAAYSYYRHGPLQRTVLGQLNVQGIDYAYTLQGWLKGVNSTTLNPDFDMGEDGKTGSPVARDVYSFGLHYYENSTQKDYKPTGTSNPFASAVNSSFKSLYNGNIAAMSVNLGALKQAEGLGVYNDALLYNYRYDQLNRIKEMQAYNGMNISTNTWLPTGINDYKELISYDPNGNILTYFRNGTSVTGINMDKMKYHYNAGNNQLNYVYDTVPAGNYSVDIDAQSANNYQYDAIENLIKDVSESITSISWNVYGKISSITKSSGNITYSYDATGNRISKTVSGVTTLYVRDASGNVLSVYEIPAANTIVQKELHIYGSGRLGMVTREFEFEDVSLSPEFGQGKIVSFIRGKKYFELSNHLGNVMAVVSDKRISVAGGVYEADIVSATDYAPFGMGLVGRSYSSEEYRYSINGQEKTPEIAPNTTTAEYWQYDARIGRRWNVDPKAHLMPAWSPYSAMFNNPILYIDPDGQYPWPVHVRSFISTSTTGGGLFRGDGRGASFTGTSRVRSVFTVDPSARNVTQPVTKSDPTVFYGGYVPPIGYIPPIVKTGTPKGSNDNISFSGNTASFDFSHSGKDPITPQWATPALDVHAGLSFTEDLENGVLTITGSFTGDVFPSTEAFITDQSGKTKLFLGAQMEKGGVGDLYGDNKENLFKVNMQIQFDDKGNFTGVQQGETTYSVKDWNKKVQEDFKK